MVFADVLYKLGRLLKTKCNFNLGVRLVLVLVIKNVVVAKCLRTFLIAIDNYSSFDSSYLLSVYCFEQTYGCSFCSFELFCISFFPFISLRYGNTCCTPPHSLCICPKSGVCSLVVAVGSRVSFFFFYIVNCFW